MNDAQQFTLLNRLIEGSSEGLWDWDLETNQTFFNEQAYRLLNIHELDASPDFEAVLAHIMPEDREATLIAMKALIEDGTPYHVEHRVPLQDGTTRYCLCRGHVTDVDSHGKPSKISGSISDITYLKQTECALRESQERLQAALSGARIGTFRWNIQADNIFWDEALCRLFGVEPEPVIRHMDEFISLLYPDDLAEVTARIEQAIQGSPSEMDFRIVLPDHSIRWIQNKGRVFFDAESKPDYMVGACIDITDAKIAQELLAKSEAHFRFISDTVPVMLWITDERHHSTYINKSWLDFTGQTEEEILGAGWLEKVHPEEQERVYKSFLMAANQKHEVNIEYKLLRHDGVYRYMLDKGSPLIDPEGNFKGYIGFVIDITPRKEAELLLQKSETRFRTLTETSTALIWQTDAQGQVIYQNPKLLEFIGVSVEQGPFPDWTPYLKPEDVPIIAQALAKAGQDNTEFNVEVELWHAASAEYRWVKSSGKPLYDTAGSFLGIVGISVDIHDLRLIQEKLIQLSNDLAQSNNDLSQFAAIASHDLKAPLRKIAIFTAQVLEEQEILSQESQDALSRIKNSAQSLQNLIDDMLNWSKLSHVPMTVTPVDLSEIVKYVKSLLKPLIQEHDAQLIIGPMETIVGDANQIEQLLYNLVDNAIKYHQPGQRPVVWIESNCVNDQFCQISVKDNGIGFQPEQAERIFEPFIRLHGKTSPYPGTGVGLAICKRIAERHGGTIKATSEPGKGTVFTVTLPNHADKKSNDIEHQTITAALDDHGSRYI
ncbi:MAG: CheY chemotaxis protein or a CheY-like [Vampirovibrio sp.]|jgi:PAS domain S-box-containing protein|nr:CheY chemotaxis protein or a CheY-like [Vampirovibrio sp.]